MTEAATFIDGAGPVLIVADHASAFVPDDIVLGVAREVMGRHVAIDIGVAPLAALLCERHGWGAVLGGVSRLVIDLNREADAAGLIPVESDGVVVPGNRDADRAGRIARFWTPYHDAVAARIAAARPALLVSLHSFTPVLATRHAPRPWEIGILYNQDDRAARIAIPRLRAAGVVTGDNEPYSGKVLNATMDRHAEAAGRPYLGIEVRQDLIADAAGVEMWAGRIGVVVGAVAEAFA